MAPRSRPAGREEGDPGGDAASLRLAARGPGAAGVGSGRCRPWPPLAALPALLLLVLLGGTAAACAPSTRAAPRVEVVPVPAPTFPALDLGGPLPDGAARRIVCLVPSCTEALFALGLGARVVGVDRWADYPPEVADLPRLGDYNGVHVERILDLSPDLVVLFRGQEDAAEALGRAGVHVLVARTISPDEVLPGLVDLAQAAGVEDRGRRLAAAIEADLAAVHDEVAQRPSPRVLVVFERHPSISVATRASFVNRLLETAGAVNVSADADPERGFVYVGLERVQDWAPDVVLDLTVTNGSADGVAEARAFWERAWPAEGRVLLVDCPPLSRPGPRMGACARILADLVR